MLFYEQRKRKTRQQAVHRQYMQRRRRARSAHARAIIQDVRMLRAQRKPAFYRVEREFAPSRGLRVRRFTLAYQYEREINSPWFVCREGVDIQRQT